MSKVALAVAAHPDDIEFIMAGTLLQLKNVGYEIHYMNVSSGHLGSMTIPSDQLIETRWRESKHAAKLLGAHIHRSISHDMEVLYDLTHVRKMTAVIRDVAPDIILTHAPADYMEDHENTSRIAVSAAFARGIPNYLTDPPRNYIEKPVTIYHAQPHGNRTQLKELVMPEYVVDVTPVLTLKKEALACHLSQKDWLDQTQGMGSYLDTMSNLNAEVGKLTGTFAFAEGWRKHLHYGFCKEQDDPLFQDLPPGIIRKLV